MPFCFVTAFLNLEIAQYEMKLLILIGWGGVEGYGGLKEVDERQAPGVDVLIIPT